MNFEHYDLAIYMVDVCKNWYTQGNKYQLSDLTVRFIKTCHNMRQICLLLTRGCFWQYLGLGSCRALGVNLLLEYMEKIEFKKWM